MSETIEDIVREMRKRFEPYAKSDSNDARYVAYLGYAEFADRIEAAVKSIEADRDNWRRQTLDEDARANATCQDSLQVGDMAAMRAALDEIRVAAMSDYEPDADYLIEKCNAALSSPPRNCDRFKPDEALSAYCEDKGITQPLPLWYGNEFWAFVNWLFDKSKGE